VTTDVAQFLICPCTFLEFQGLYSKHYQQSFGLSAATFYEEGIQKLVPRNDKCLINGCEYVEKFFEENVESDNNNFFTKPYSIFFYSETVLTF